MAISKKTWRKIFIVIAVFVIIATSLWEYFEGYKDQYLFSILRGVIIMACWFAMFYLLFDNKNKENTIFNTNKLAQVFIAFVFVVCAIANSFIAGVLAEDRAKNILNTRPTKTSQATVIRIEYRGKYGASPYAIINYVTDKGIVEQAVYNTHPSYYEGEVYEVTYSAEYPEMYRIGKQIKK